MVENTEGIDRKALHSLRKIFPLLKHHCLSSKCENVFILLCCAALPLIFLSFSVCRHCLPLLTPLGEHSSRSKDICRIPLEKILANHWRNVAKLIHIFKSSKDDKRTVLDSKNTQVTKSQKGLNYSCCVRPQSKFHLYLHTTQNQQGGKQNNWSDNSSHPSCGPNTVKVHLLLLSCQT